VLCIGYCAFYSILFRRPFFPGHGVVFDHMNTVSMEIHKITLDKQTRLKMVTIQRRK